MRKGARGSGDGDLQRLLPLLGLFFLGVEQYRLHGVCLFLYKREVSAQRTDDGVSDSDCDHSVSGDADQRAHQTVVVRDMSTAQGPLAAGHALVTHREFWFRWLLHFRACKMPFNPPADV